MHGRQSAYPALSLLFVVGGVVVVETGFQEVTKVGLETHFLAQLGLELLIFLFYPS